MSEEQPVRQEGVHAAEPAEAVPVDLDLAESDAPQETEEEKELREMKEAAARGELELTVEQARKWQHALGLPDAALPPNDNEADRQ